MLYARKASSAAAILGLSLAACGSPSPPANPPSAGANAQTAPFRYADCMRAHGVPNFPEPRVQTSAGATKVAMVAPSSLAHTPAFRAASHACRSLMPSGPIGESPAQQRALGVALLSFARCMRAHGIHNFPDPTPQGRITREMLAAANINLALPNVQKGAFDCVSATHGAITAAQVREAINHGA